MRICHFLPGLLFLVAAIGCAPSKAAPETIRLATTTSTQDTGLLDTLLPMFEKQTGIKVKVIAVGSGQALEMGRRGDVDVLLTHAPTAEEKFVAEGYGTDRQPVMHNDFVLVGPKDNPAGVKGKEAIAEAFKQIARSKSPFVSRGDESGTHMMEQQIWRSAGIKPEGSWYIQAGGGMAQTLRMANEKKAYTISDRGTFLSQRSSLDLKVQSEGDPLLLNRYSVILVSPSKHPHVHHDAARKFADFLQSPETQQAIARFGVEKFGEQLFFRNQERSK